MIVASLPLLGHALPMAAVVRALFARGHTPCWATGEQSRRLVEGAGAILWPLPFEGWTPQPTVQDAARRCLDAAPAQYAACQGLPEGEPILADPTMVGVHRYAVEHGHPLAILGILPFLGIPDGAMRVFQTTVADFEPWVFWEGQPVTFVGPLTVRSPHVDPPWWEEAMASPLPRVLVTQGTLECDPSQLILPALEGLGATVTAMATSCPPTGGVRCATWLDIASVVPQVDCVVTNGGYGVIQQALRAGVPVVVAGTTDDKRLNGVRVAYSGLGTYLDPPYTPERIRMAVETVLTTPRYRERARELASRCPTEPAADQIAHAMLALEAASEEAAA